MAKPPDIGHLTQDQTAALAIECLGLLPLAERVQAVLKAFTDEDERGELTAWLADPEDDEKTTVVKSPTD
jgi:hypothetical protein